MTKNRIILPTKRLGISQFQKHPRHDKNWWLWNLEAKEKPLITSSQDKEDKDNHKLVYKRSAYRLEPEKGLIFEEALSRYHNLRKRWLSSSFGFVSRKNLNKEARKWQIDSESSGPNSSSNTRVIQDPWMSKRKLADRNRSEMKFWKHSGRSRGNFRKRVHPQTVQQQRHFESHPATLDNIVSRGSDLADHTTNLPIDQRYQTRIPGPTMKTYGDLKPLPSLYTQVWNKSYDPIYGRYVTPFTELKFNPLKQPYPFHDPRSSIPWYTPLNRYKAEPTRKFVIQPGSEEVMNKQVAKLKGKSEFMKQGGRNEEIELIPKVYALSKLKDRKQLKKFSNQNGWSKSATNPLIVPGFKRKYIDITSEDNTMRPFLVRAGEQAGIPFDDEYIQVSRGNRNQTKLDNISNDHKLAFAGPLQLPGPYAFPGGVNISILVPNLPSLSHEASQIATSISTEKNSKKKKERRKKFKYDDRMRDDLLSAPRSQATPQADCDQSLSGEMDLIKYQPLNPDVECPVFNFKENNFTLWNHIRNIPLDQVNWDKAFGIQTESAKKELSYDDDDDEIRMLYDEQPPTTTQQSTEKVMEKSWYRFTDYVSKIPNAQSGGKFRIVEDSVDDPSDVTDVTFLGGARDQPGNRRTILHTDEEPANASKLNSFDSFSGTSRDQWDVLDEDLKNIASGKRNEAVWRLKNRKREADYESNEKDVQGYYHLSSGENVLRNPTGLIISAFRKKANKHRDRDYYDEIPENRIRGRKRIDDRLHENAE